MHANVMQAHSHAHTYIHAHACHVHAIACACAYFACACACACARINIYNIYNIYNTHLEHGVVAAKVNKGWRSARAGGAAPGANHMHRHMSTARGAPCVKAHERRLARGSSGRVRVQGSG